MLKLFRSLLLIFFMSLFSTHVMGNYDKLAYDFNFKDLDGSTLELSDYKDKIIVVVNVASKCGFTNQYEDMQKVWDKYQEKGLIMLGIPSNDFGNQEPGNNADIKNFCEAKFGINFPMTEKVKVKGEDAHPFYLWAKKNYGKSAVPKWNFHKIIISRDGKVFKTFTSMTNPTSSKFIDTIEELIR